MQKSPIHAPDHADLPMDLFLLKEWYAEKDIGEIDRHPITNERFQNIFQVRVAKLVDWNAVASCLPYTYVMKYEDLVSNATQAILDLAKTFEPAGLRLKNPNRINTSVCVISFGGCVNKKEKNQTKIRQESEAKRQYYINHQYLSSFERGTSRLILQNLNQKIEEQFGYNYSHVMKFMDNREIERLKVGLSPEKMSSDKRRLPKPKRKPRKNRKKWKGV